MDQHGCPRILQSIPADVDHSAVSMDCQCADLIVEGNAPRHKAGSRSLLKALSVRQTRFQRSNTQIPTPAFIATLQAQAAERDAASQAKASYTPSQAPAIEPLATSQPFAPDSTSGNAGLLETLPPNVLADGTPIDWAEWDYLLQDLELQNASFAQT